MEVYLVPTLFWKLEWFMRLLPNEMKDIELYRAEMQLNMTEQFGGELLY